MDKMQRNLMMFLPLFFVAFIINFPTGLLIYWVTTNLWTVGQGLITRHLVPKTPAPNPFARAKKPPEDAGGRGGGNGAKKQPPPPKPTPAPAAAVPPQRQVRKRKKGARR
jgi:YidC/Oxa1 family membrane protein insertase